MRAKTVIAIKCKYLRFWDIIRLDLFVNGDKYCSRDNQIIIYFQKKILHF